MGERRDTIGVTEPTMGFNLTLLTLPLKTKEEASGIFKVFTFQDCAVHL